VELLGTCLGSTMQHLTITKLEAEIQFCLSVLSSLKASGLKNRMNFRKSGKPDTASHRPKTSFHKFVQIDTSWLSSRAWGRAKCVIFRMLFEQPLKYSDIMHEVLVAIEGKLDIYQHEINVETRIAISSIVAVIPSKMLLLYKL
jgi:hypothetical protein